MLNHRIKCIQCISNVNSLYQCSCKQCCAIAGYAMCHSVINPSCRYWTSGTLSPLVSNGNTPYNVMVWKDIFCQLISWKWEYQWNWDKPYCLRCKQWCPTRCNLAESKSVLKMCISKHCHEVTGFLSWIGTYCISCVVRQRSRVKDLSVLVGYDDSVLPRILGRAGGLMTQILIVLVQSICFDKLPFLFHASWVDCLSFPSWVVILLKM